jgi:hypothetical protein
MTRVESARMDELQETVAAAVAEIRAAWQRAAEVIDRWPDPARALAAAADLAEGARAVPDELGLPLRGRQALRVRAARELVLARDLSLAELARELGGSKSLAHKLVTAATEEVPA